MMPKVTCAVILIAFFCNSLNAQENEENLTVIDMYYDADDSVFGDWLRGVAANEYIEFQSYLGFNMFPCESMKVDETAKTLECVPLDKDCYLNKIHVCARENIKDPDKVIAISACTAMTKNGIPNIDQCLQKNPLLKEQIDCANSPKGYQLCLEQYKADIPVGNFPSFVIRNDNSTKIIRGVFDFKKILCVTLKQFGVPYPEKYCAPIFRP